MDFRSWTVDEVIQRASVLKGTFAVGEGKTGGAQLLCHDHEDVARLVLSAPPGECKVSNSKKEQLMAP